MRTTSSGQSLRMATRQLQMKATSWCGFSVFSSPHSALCLRYAAFGFYIDQHQIVRTSAEAGQRLRGLQCGIDLQAGETKDLIPQRPQDLTLADVKNRGFRCSGLGENSHDSCPELRPACRIRAPSRFSELNCSEIELYVDSALTHPQDIPRVGD